MKISKKDANADMVKILQERLGNETILNLMTSFATMSDIMARYLMTNDIGCLPKNVCYAIAQIHGFLNFMYLAFHHPQEIQEGIEMKYFCPYDEKDLADAEERFIFVIKTFHEKLKKDGKL